MYNVDRIAYISKKKTRMLSTLKWMQNIKICDTCDSYERDIFYRYKSQNDTWIVNVFINRSRAKLCKRDYR